MNVEELRSFCIKKKGVEEGFPFGPETLVFKVGGKIFMLLSLDSEPVQFNLKCEPSYAEELREQYSSILPGYHMNKKHWNTMIMDGKIPRKKIEDLIDLSYILVEKTLPKKRMKK